MVHQTLQAITNRIITRSQATRARYLDQQKAQAKTGPARRHLSCSGQAHAYAGACDDQSALAQQDAGNLGIVTAYNDMLSAHQPFATYPDIIKAAVRSVGGTAQVAGGVPAMCDGVTQGEAGMELSLFSRDVIALAAGIALSHQTFDAAVFLGVCDKIVPGLVIAAQSFGHLPCVFIPAGPMTSGLANDAKAKVREQFATGACDRDALMQAEMQAYHGPGTCTFYGTANTNQMLMEFMGLHLPGASFVNPHLGLRQALTKAAATRALALSHLGENYTPTHDILTEKAFVNGMVGLMATGGSTNLVLHMVAMARAGGIILTLQDFADISELVPLLTRVYPNGLADVNHFHAAGGLGLVIAQLRGAGLLHDDVQTVAGPGLSAYTTDPKMIDGTLTWVDGPAQSLNDKIITTCAAPFQETGGLRMLDGNLGQAIMKISAVDPDNRVVTAPAAVFHDQAAVKAAFQAGDLNRDVVVVVRYQGPKANGMPELHSLTPMLCSLQARGFRVALVTDGRMSGASGKMPAAIHVSPEALDDGPIARVCNGDVVTVDATTGQLTIDADLSTRTITHPDLSEYSHGTGRDLFAAFRAGVGTAADGASIF